MKEKSVKIIIILITVAVFGLIGIQFYWINNSMELEEKTFDKNVGVALANVIAGFEKQETAKVLLKTIAKTDSTNLVFEKDTTIKTIKIKNRKTITKQGKNKFDYDINVLRTDSSTTANLKVITNFNSSASNVNSNVIILNSDVDTLISNKNKIIEKVFDELLLNANEENLIDRINQTDLHKSLSDEFNKYGISTPFNFAIHLTENDSILFAENKIEIAQLKNSQHKAKLFPNDVFTQPNFLLVSFPDKTNFIYKSNWFVLMISALLTILIISLFYATIKMLIKQKKITEVKNDLLNNITHEFKTPISTISLATDIIAEQGLGKEKKTKYLSAIKNESKRLTGMVENILTTASLEKNEIAINKKRIDVNKIILEVVEQFDLMAEKENGKIITDFNTGKIFFKTDENHLRLIIINLIDNALKYNSNFPEVIISTKKINEGIEILIKDNGIGISKTEQKKIFDTFYRVPTGNIHNVKGNGIGLSSVKKIVETNKGTISIESELNKGSTFKIFLPYE